MDTVQANIKLGFGEDERIMESAPASCGTWPGKVRLISNNPVKRPDLKDMEFKLSKLFH